MLRHPGLGAQVFEHDPQGAHRRGVLPRHRLGVGIRNPAAERVHDDIRGQSEIGVRGPVADLDPVERLLRPAGRELRRERTQRTQVVDPQARLRTGLRGEPAREAPAHRGVAEVVHHAAEHVEGAECAHQEPAATD